MDIRLQKLIDIDAYLAKTMKGFYEYLSDKEIPLEVRWESFKKYGHHLECEQTSCHSYGPIDLCYMYDPPDRYRTYMYADDMEYLEEILYLNEDGKSSYYTFDCCAKALKEIGIIYEEGINVDEWNAQIKEFIDELKEDILNGSSSGYIYDW